MSGVLEELVTWTNVTSKQAKELNSKQENVSLYLLQYTPLSWFKRSPGRNISIG